MERNRFVQYKTNQQKYTLLFFGQGLRRIFTDLRYTGVAILLILLEVKAYFVICDMLDTMELWPMLFQLYKKVLIFPLAVVFALAVIELGRPKGFRRIMREIEKIPELLNGDKEAPILISRKKIKGKRTERWIFDSYGIKRQVQKSTKSKTDDVSNTRRAFYIIQRALSVYKIIKEDWDEKNPQSTLPRIDWNPPRNRTVALEQVKTLGDRIRQRFCEELYKRSELEPALAKSAVMMMLSLRTAEAAAITAGDVSFIEDEKVGLYAVVKVYSQVKKRKNKVSDLKTPQSVRLITAGYWAATMLQKCFKTIQASERSGIVDPAVLSGWILDVLETVGFNTKDVTPPALNAVDIGDLSAYILRRDAASLMMNVMGLEPYEYARLIGHTLNESEFKHEDSRHPEEQRKVVQKQSRYIYSTRITNNPSVVPIELKHGDDQKTIDYTEIHFTAPQAASHGLFVFQAREAGESIRIRCPKHLVEAIKVYNRQFETQDRPALGRAEIERSKDDQEETTSC